MDTGPWTLPRRNAGMTGGPRVSRFLLPRPRRARRLLRMPLRAPVGLPAAVVRARHGTGSVHAHLLQFVNVVRPMRFEMQLVPSSKL